MFSYILCRFDPDKVPAGLFPNVDQGITELLNGVKEQLVGNRGTPIGLVLAFCQGEHEDPVCQWYQFFQPAGTVRSLRPREVGHCCALGAIQVQSIPDSS